LKFEDGRSGEGYHPVAEIPSEPTPVSRGVDELEEQERRTTRWRTKGERRNYRRWQKSESKQGKEVARITNRMNGRKK
jgi:hypothetical protein